MSAYDPTKYTDVMLDLETLGTAPGSAIIALGAVFMVEGMPEDEWAVYEAPVVAVNTCRAIGLTEDAATHLWWSQQSEEARTVYDAAMRNEGEHIVNVLQRLAAFFPPGARMWGNGANFDNVLLRVACARAAVAEPCSYYKDMCYRTMKTEFDFVPKPEFQGVKHNALTDALHQARHLQKIWGYKRTLELTSQPVQKVSEGGD